MTHEQLLDWIRAYDTTEKHRNILSKARSTWKRSKAETHAELEKRTKRHTKRQVLRTTKK